MKIRSRWSGPGRRRCSAGNALASWLSSESASSPSSLFEIHARSLTAAAGTLRRRAVPYGRAERFEAVAHVVGVGVGDDDPLEELAGLGRAPPIAPSDRRATYHCRRWRSAGLRTGRPAPAPVSSGDRVGEVAAVGPVAREHQAPFGEHFRIGGSLAQLVVEAPRPDGDDRVRARSPSAPGAGRPSPTGGRRPRGWGAPPSSSPGGTGSGRAARAPKARRGGRPPPS